MNIVVIGGSAGAFPVIREITSHLSQDMNAAFFITLHFPGDKESQLPRILNAHKVLPAVHATHDVEIERGKIYVAPPGLHMLIQKGKIFLSDGPKENRFRPSIDVMFRSAAIAYGPAVTGLVLSGLLDDGTAGLVAIKKRGGKTIVQDPHEALIDSMPLNAIKAVEVDHCVPSADIPRILYNISKENKNPIDMETDHMLEWENSFAEGKTYQLEEITKHANPSRYICPLCEGPLFKLKDQKLNRFRCFTGHGFSAETLLREINIKMEHLLWTVYRTLDEKREMLENMMEGQPGWQREEAKINEQLVLLSRLRRSSEQDTKD